MIFYIADLHLFDLAIFNKCKRPFKSLNEMEENIINNWNAKVTKNDDVYVLGDIGNEDKIDYLSTFKKLNGNKYLIVGNHDHNLISEINDSGLFKSIKFIDLIMDNNRKVCVCHYPLMDWMELNRDGMLVYGHIHNKTFKNGLIYKQIKEFYTDKPAYNCGVDVTNFSPMTLDEMINLKEENKHEAYIN